MTAIPILTETSMLWLRVATAVYAVGLIHVLLLALRRHSSLAGVAERVFPLAVVLHAVSLVETSLAVGGFPAHTFYETVSLGALLIALLFLFISWRYRFPSVSVFVYPLVFLMALMGSLGQPVASWANQDLRGAWLAGHVVLVLLGYAALVLTVVASVFYLLQERALKRKRPGALFDRLPPLGTLDELISRSMAWGFAFITLSLVAGSTWGFIESGTRWIGHPGVALSFLTWGFYLLMVFLRVGAGWRGRKAALMAVTVLGCSALTWAAHVGLRSLLTQ